MRLFLNVLIVPFTLVSAQTLPAGEDALGTKTYDQYEKPAVCASCHTDIYMQWTQAMMSQAYTHHWDEIEYFELAVPHGEKDPQFKPVADGCNGCHAPLAFLAGDVPPPKPAEGSRANESVSCDLCHTIVGSHGAEPFNFSWMSDPGKTKYGPKPGLESPHHITQESDFMKQAEYCGTCHNEKNPFGIWVKSTQLEWAEGPYAEEGVPCHTCHMPKAWMSSAKMAKPGMVAQHLFHGAHDPGKLASVIEIRMHPSEREVEFDETVQLTIQLFNAKTGHKFPSGSVEDRIVWLHVEAEDAEGKTYHLPVDRKGFEGEDYTIASDDLAYTDMAIPLGLDDFRGVKRDAIPVGDRIFRMPYFDENGIMTIQQWNTRALGVDYRIGPRETKIETYTFEMPDDIAMGVVKFKATMYYSRLVPSVAEFLEVPAEESVAELVNTGNTWIEVYD